MKVIGIYKIESKNKPHRAYIGSSVNINGRWQLHISDLRHNRHHSRKLQRHYNKYGESDLLFSILLSCEKDELLKIEQYFIDAIKPYFNECLIAGRFTGFKHSLKTRQLMSEHSKGMLHSEETKKKMSLSMRGIKKSEEAKLKMSIAKKGKPTWNKGKKGIYSKETLEKIRNGHIGKPSPMLGKRHTDDSKRKMSETRKINYRLKKTA